MDIYDGDSLDDDLGRIARDLDKESIKFSINAFITEICENEGARWTLLRRSGEFSNPYFNCKAIECFQEEGYNVYRIRPLISSLERVRIIYAYDCDEENIYLLAAGIKPPRQIASIVEREKYYNYEPDHPLSVRIREEYDRYGFRKI